MVWNHTSSKDNFVFYLIPSLKDHYKINADVCPDITQSNMLLCKDLSLDLTELSACKIYLFRGVLWAVINLISLSLVRRYSSDKNLSYYSTQDYSQDYRLQVVSAVSRSSRLFYGETLGTAQLGTAVAPGRNRLICCYVVVVCCFEFRRYLFHKDKNIASWLNSGHSFRGQQEVSNMA